MIWVAGRSPTLVSQNLKATTLTYLAIACVPKALASATLRYRLRFGAIAGCDWQKDVRAVSYSGFTSGSSSPSTPLSMTITLA
jgi:hypothetical protein